MAWWDRFRGVPSSRDEVVAAPRPKRVDASPCDPISGCADRSRVRVRGTIQALEVRPHRTRPWLEADLGDGTGTVRLVWMGRDRIPGIEVGRSLLVEGRVSMDAGVRRIYNPRYELQA